MKAFYRSVVRLVRQFTCFILLMHHNKMLPRRIGLAKLGPFCQFYTVTENVVQNVHKRLLYRYSTVFWYTSGNFWYARTSLKENNSESPRTFWTHHLCAQVIRLPQVGTSKKSTRLTFFLIHTVAYIHTNTRTYYCLTLIEIAQVYDNTQSINSSYCSTGEN